MREGKSPRPLAAKAVHPSHTKPTGFCDGDGVVEEIAMSIFHCQAKAISRAAGRSAIAAAAYRAGERIIDERTGDVHDYRRKKGIRHTQIFVPPGVRIPSRSALWNMAETTEKRKDAKVAREWEVALPAELNSLDRWHLAQHFARAIVERYGVAVDMCVHAPGKKGTTEIITSIFSPARAF